MAGKGQPRTGGRKPGSPNLITVALKDAILNAFTKVGGEDYLVKVALADPKTFCALLGRVLPMQLVGAGDGPVRLQIITGVPASPEDSTPSPDA